MPEPGPEYELGEFFDLARDLFCIVSADGYATLVNESYERVLGYPREELLSRPITDFVHPDDRSRVRDTIGVVFAGEDDVAFEDRVVCADGSVRRIEWNTRTMPDLGFAYSIGRDVTERTALAEQQAALRRVATLVARESPPDEVFAAVAEEMGHLLGAPSTTLWRFEDDETATLAGRWGALHADAPVGARFAVGGANVASEVFRTARPARMDDYADASGEIGTTFRSLGVRSAVAMPIIVRGRLWGAMGAAATEQLPEQAEPRMGEFSELIATALANIEARNSLARLAEEQAALRRVATLVARESSPGNILTAVADEVCHLIRVETVALCRYEDAEAITVLARSGAMAATVPANTRMALDGDSVTLRVLQTGRPARTDHYDEDTSGEVARHGKAAGVRSAAGAPIVVNGRLWGVMIAASSVDKLPSDTESRMAAFTELVATAIANVDARAEIAASRARLVAAADEERRQVVRDLHDGAQARLVHTVVTLKLAQRALEGDPADAASLMGEALEHAQRATNELRELAHGILPATLTSGGLGAGVGALAARMPLPVQLEIAVERLPATIEATAYFLVAEALTNVAKHANATTAAVAAVMRDGTLRIEVCDDGIGGARPDGSGLQGLADRLAAIDGRLQVTCPADGGTRVEATIPIPRSAIGPPTGLAH